MTLNIKDPEAHKLARQLARQTGETMTRAVTLAIRERLDRVTRASTQSSAVEDLLAIGGRCAATLSSSLMDHGSLLYDEHGLPE